MAKGAGNNLSIRLPDDLRDRLEHAARESGQKLSDQIRWRLTNSFADNLSIEERYGDRRNAAFMHLLALAILEAMPPDKPPSGWLDNVALYETVAAAVQYIFRFMDPRAAPSDDALEDLYTRLFVSISNSPKGRPGPTAKGQMAAMAVLDALKNDESLERVEASVRHDLRDLLGRIPERLWLLHGIRDELKKG